MVGIKSDAGNVRELNEDYASFIENEQFKIYLVVNFKYLKKVCFKSMDK